MARKVFVSYKYADSSVASISNGYSWYNKSTVRDYVDLIENRMGNTNCAYYKGERNNQDLSYLTEDMIWEKLKDKIYIKVCTINHSNMFANQSSYISQNLFIYSYISFTC